MNVTCAPRMTVTFWGDTPLLVIVIVAPPVLPPEFELEKVVLSPSPQAISINRLTVVSVHSNLPLLVIGCGFTRVEVFTKPSLIRSVDDAPYAFD
jgi:hypothetical protein